jgi:hypothetical protein
MTKLLLGLLLVSNLAYAEIWYEAVNLPTEKIILTHIDCEQKENQPTTKKMYATTAGVKTSRGCWHYKNGSVYVIDSSGEIYSYPPDIFTFKQYK